MAKPVSMSVLANRVTIAGMSLGAFLVLSACQSSGTDGVLTNILPKRDANTQVAAAQPSQGTNPNARNKLINTQNSLTDYCPTVRLRAGMESIRFYKGRDRENSDNIRYQATITKVARQCTYVGQNLEIKVGALGRVITGPAGGAGAVKLPIRVAVQEGRCSRHFELHRTDTSVAEGSSFSKFEFVDETIVIPAPTATNVRIFVGFDETPDAKASAQPCAS